MTAPDGSDARDGADASDGGVGAGTGRRHDVADRIEQWVVPVVRWVRRTLWAPLAAGLLAAVVAGAAALAWKGVDGTAIALAAVAVAVVGLPAFGIILFVRLLGELERLPDTIRSGPEHVADLRDEMAEARTEARDLRKSGLLGLMGALGWLRRTLGRLDTIGVAGVAAAVTALHPLRLAWIVLLSWLSVVALPVAVYVLVLALRA